MQGREFIFLGGAALLATIVVANAQLSPPTLLPETPEAFGTVLNAWAAKYHVERALVVVRRNGKIVYQSTLGGANASAPVHLASLSKAITGACVATLIRDRKLAFETPLSRILAKFFAAYGKPSDPRVADVTVAQLLTHRAGFSGNADNNDADATRELAAYLKQNSARQPPNPRLLVAAFKRPLAHQPGSEFVYSNTGYLALGAVVEEATGKPYLSYCRPDDRRLGSEVKSWMLSPEGKTVSGDGQVWYGLGTNVRKAGAGANLWHWGAWRFNLTGAKDGTLRSSFVTFAVRENSGTSWFVHATPRVEEGPARLELDRGLFSAFRAVRRWN